MSTELPQRPKPPLSDDTMAARRVAAQEVEWLEDVLAAARHLESVLLAGPTGLPRPSELIRQAEARIQSLRQAVSGRVEGRQRPKQQWQRWDAARPRALISVDETGLSKGRHPAAPYFAAAAVMMRTEDIPTIESAIAEWSFRHFGRLRYVHELDVRKGTGAFYFDGDTERRKSAWQELARMLQDLPYTVTAVVIDKARFEVSHPDGRGDAVLPTRLYPLVVNMLFERVVHWLWTEGDRRGDLEAEGIGESEDAFLQQAVADLKLRGTRFQSERWFRYQLADYVSFHGKAHLKPGLQLADWVVKACADAARAAREHEFRIDDAVPHPLWPVIRPHLYDGRQAREDTFGVKVYPGLNVEERAWLFPECDVGQLPLWEPEKLKGPEA